MTFVKTAIFALLLPASLALAECPKTKKERHALGPKMLVETAVNRATKVEIPDFAKDLGKKGASAKATPFKERRGEFVLVEAKHPSEPIFLSGVMKCDLGTKQPVLMSLTWVKGDKSGFVKLH